MTEFWTVVTICGYLVTLLLIPWVLLLKKPQPTSTIAWIFAIVALPYVGGFLFLLFGLNRLERRAVRKQRASRYIGQNLGELTQYQVIPGEAESPQQKRLMRLAHHVGRTIATYGNEVEVLDDTNRTLGLIEQAIKSAKESVNLEYYIWQPDKTGESLRDLLIEKAREGVTIRFLYDGIGSLWLNNRFFKPMREAGIQIAGFLPGQTFRERWSLNLRNHRKIVIVDGQIGFTGGMNIGDEYLGKSEAYGYWRDTHLRIRGPAVLQLQQVFVEDWYYATNEALTIAALFPEPQQIGQTAAQVLSGGPADEVPVFHALMFAAINEAQRDVTLASSYFVPTEPLLAALETAAYRGVKVRIMTAGHTSYIWTVVAGRSYYDELLNAGAEVYEYERGLMHAKTLTIDGNWSLVGTPNFDARSLLLNFEVAIAMYSTKVAEELERQFNRDLEYCLKVNRETWSQRPIWGKVAENICRLFAPVL